MRLCRSPFNDTTTDCKLFFINGDDDPADKVLGFQDVMYATQLSEMSFSEGVASATSVQVRNTRFPQAACTIVDQDEYNAYAEYAVIARKSSGMQESCEPSRDQIENDLREDKFNKIEVKDVSEVCSKNSDVRRTVGDLKPNTTYCVYLLYKVTYRGKQIDGDVAYLQPIRTDEADPLMPMIAFIALAIVLLIIVIAVVKCFVEPKYQKIVKGTKNDARRQADAMKDKLDIAYAGLYDYPPRGKVVEYADEIGCKLDRERDFARARQQEKLAALHSSSGSFGSQETIPLPDHQKAPVTPPPSYVQAETGTRTTTGSTSSSGISSQGSSAADDEGYYTRKPDQT